MSIRARVCAESMELAGCDRFITMDLHSPQVQGFFKRPMDHLYAMPMLCEMVKKELDLSNAVVVSPEPGSPKQAVSRRLAGTPSPSATKQRTDHTENAQVLEDTG